MSVLRITKGDEAFEIDPDRILFAEGRAIEKVTGSTFAEVMQALGKGSLESIQALTWVAAKRSNPELKFTDLDAWDLGDVSFEELPDDDDPDATADPTPATDDDSVA